MFSRFQTVMDFVLKAHFPHNFIANTPRIVRATIGTSFLVLSASTNERVRKTIEIKTDSRESFAESAVNG